MEINVVILHKLIKTMSRQMRAVIKAQGSPTKQCVFFGRAVKITRLTKKATCNG